MESFQENKVFGDVFCRYLKSRFGCNYQTVDPLEISIPNDYPDVDLVLNSNRNEYLYLQLKQPIKFEKYERLGGKSWAKVFRGDTILFEEITEKAEATYIKQGKNIRNIIFILHIGLFNGDIEYWYTRLINKVNFDRSGFRGIYIISPVYTAYTIDGEEIVPEFVFEIKDAFSCKT